MPDILCSAAKEYQKLKNIKYRIVIGRKGKSYNIMLHFPPEAFFHLAGLQHLEDITFPSTNKERIYKEILQGKFTLENIRASVFYEKCFIEERLLDFSLLKEMIESDSLYYMINLQRYIQYTNIKADYLCEYKYEKEIVYLFLVIEKFYPKFKDECKGCSLFTKHGYDYSLGTSKTTILLIERIENDESIIVYKNPSYKL